MVERPVFEASIKIRFVRAAPDSFETYRLVNDRGLVMQLVCARNRAYDDNKLPFLEYRNFYGEVARFEFSSDKACKALGRFIELAHAGIDEDEPLLMELQREEAVVTKISYPNLDPFATDGELEDLLPRKKVKVLYDKKSSSTASEGLKVH